MDSDPSLSQTSLLISDQSTKPSQIHENNGAAATDSESDGFLSGEEGDLDPEPTRPILVYPPSKSPVDVDDPLLDDQAHRPIAKVTADDEDDDNGSVTADDEKEKLSQAVQEKGADADFGDTNDVFVEASGVADDDKGPVVVENGVELKNDDGEGFQPRGGVDVENGVELHDSTKKEEDAVEEQGIELSHAGDGGTNHSDSVDGGDSLVDSVQVNVLDSGVAVVGDEVDVEESQIKGLDAPPRGVSLDNGFDPIEKGVIDKVDESGQNVDVGVDDGHEHKSDIVPLEEGGGSEFASGSMKDEEDGINMEVEGHGVEGEIGSHLEVEAAGEDDEEEVIHGGDREIDGSMSDGKDEGVVFGSSDAASKYLEELERHSAGGGNLQDARIDGQIVTDSDEEEESDDEGDGKELFDTATLAALLKAASGADQDGGSITITSQDGSRLFSVERPAGLGSSLQSGKPAVRPNRPSLFNPSISRASAVSDSNLTDEEKKKLEKLQQIRIKYLRLVHRLGFTPDESIAAQVLYRLSLVAGRQTGQLFSLDAAKETASQLEAEGREDFDFSINILVLGKTGVGKSATINSIFGETKTSFNAYGPATTAVTEIVGVVDGVKIRMFDTPGLKSSAFEQSSNRKVLSMVKKLTKKSPPDIVLYVDRLDLQTRDMNDLPMLRSITSALGPSIWRNVIVTLTHGASAPPDGPSGAPLSYDVFVAQRSHIVQQIIGQAVGDLRLMNPSLMNPVSLVENHPSCRKNRDGQKVLPNGQSWRPLLLLLCYSMKILSEAGNVSKSQESSFDHRRLFGFRSRSPPLPYLLSWLLQSRTYPKLPADQGGVDNGDSDIEMADLSDSDLDEDEDEYDQLPPFKPLKKSQIAKLNREQKKAYFEEYDYRVKLLQKKQWREELKRMRDMKKKGKSKVSDYGYMEEDDQENGAPAAVPVPLPDMVLPPSFDSDNPAYRYRFLEPTSQLLTRPVLDNHGWDHDCGYDGVNIEQSLAIINQFPAAVTVQVTKDKKDFSIHLDSSVAAKLADNGSAMAGFDIQNIGKQLAYIVRGETKFKNFKRNKTAAGVSMTFLGENVSTGLKVEDQIALGKRLVLVGSTGIVRSQTDSACGANFEVRLREADFPIGQDQSALSFSLVKWRGDLALGANLQSQFSVGRSYKMAVRAALNNKLSGQITVRTSSSDQVQIALLAILPIARAIYKNFWPGASENYSIY
ncbi:translocase of chloroplast 159, chloroplastic-like [Abrus precatorius]|uniref:Translocase of chloroplast 159, chloroplastic-like n=1 Tax=Abrus precatorius TaxID=3816 RepID=A0A8B8KSX7_ABRPR|nr:translocase of chloroplast 159, chloroplastic-like [Abrus precatorius]